MSVPEILAAVFIGFVTLCVWAWIVVMMVMGALSALRDIRVIEQRRRS